MMDSRSRPQFWICVVTTDILGMGHVYTGSGTHSDTLHLIPFVIQFTLIFRHWTPCLPTNVENLFFTNYFSFNIWCTGTSNV